MDLSDLLQECRAYSAEQSSVDYLENRPAVYAFYDLLRFDPSTMCDAIDAFKTKHARVLSLKKEEKGTSFLPEHVRIRLRGNPERFKGEGLRLVKQLSSEQLQDVSRLLMFLSFFNEPLYIGKTNRMRIRFQRHHDKDFLYSMKSEYQRDPSEFLLFVCYSQQEYVRVTESILLQLVNPPFCDQKS